MIITHKFDMAVDRRGPAPVVDAVQGEDSTRVVQISLYTTPEPNKKEPWAIPDGVSPMVRFRKKDGTGGIFDVLPDGTDAITLEGNVITAVLAPQMLTFPGTVLAQVELTAGTKSMATFSFHVEVQPDPSIGTMESKDYYSLSKYVLQEVERILAEGDASLGAEEVVISSEAPVGGNAKIWINPDEEEEEGGSTILTVTATDNGDGTYTCSHTFEQVKAWIDGNGAAELRYGTAKYVANRATPAFVYFELTTGNASFVAVYQFLLSKTGVLQAKEFKHVTVNPTAEVGQTIIVEEVDDNGQPTKWKAVDYQKKICYDDVVIAEATYTIDEEVGAFVLPDIWTTDEEIIANTAADILYVVKYNGVEYQCRFVDNVAMGNVPVLMETGDNGIPFCIVLEGGFFCVPFDGSTSATISISKPVAIPQMYCGNAFPYYVEVGGSGTTEDPYVCNETIANLTEIYNSGREIKLKWTASTGYTAFGVLSYMAGLQQLIFIVLPVGSGVSNTQIVLTVQDDGTYAVSNSFD